MAIQHTALKAGVSGIVKGFSIQLVSGMKIIQVPLTEDDATMLQVALGRSDIRKCLNTKDSAIAGAFDVLYAALTKAINDSW